MLVEDLELARWYLLPAGLSSSHHPATLLPTGSIGPSCAAAESGLPLPQNLQNLAHYGPRETPSPATQHPLLRGLGFSSVGPFFKLLIITNSLIPWLS